MHILRLKHLGLKLLFFQTTVHVQEKEEAAEMGFKILVLLPRFMFYMESVNEFVKPKIVETKEAKSPSAMVPLQRNKSANYNRKT